MLYQINLFFGRDIPNPMKYWVEAMERGLVHVDAVNKYGDTLGVAFVRESELYWQQEYWRRYWARKPNVYNFWTNVTRIVLPGCYQAVILSRMADIPALWEDLPFLCNLVTVHSSRLARLLPELLPELDRRVPASIRFAWIAAVVW